MIDEITSVFTDKQEPLVFLPIASFGYLFVKTGDQLFLFFSILVAAGTALIAESINSDEQQRLTQKGRIVFWIVFPIWSVGYLFAIAFLLIELDRFSSDILYVGLFLANIILLFMSIFGTGNWVMEDEVM